jgi:uncharacterized protein DUF5681
MSPPSEKEKVGYGHPPRSKRWKAGQSGNSRRRTAARERSTLAMIDSLFLNPVEITMSGAKTRVSTLEAIIRLISQKALLGDRQALAAQMKYEEFAAQFRDRKLRIVFVDSEYTEAVATEVAAVRAKDE